MITDETATDTQNETAEVATTGKSIVSAKYRGKYKTPDWLGQLLIDNASVKKTIPAKPASEQVGKIGEEGYKPAKEATPERIVNDGVDVDALFALGRENGLNLDKLETQRTGHGFAGRFRMTVRNMLQTIVKQRHGLVVNGTFVSAPSEFLTKVGILEGQAPTHTQDGTKIAKPKAETAGATEEPTPESESKLIKTSAKAKAKK